MKSKSHFLGLKDRERTCVWRADGWTGGGRAGQGKEGILRGQQQEPDHIQGLDATRKYTENLGSKASLSEKKRIRTVETERIRMKPVVRVTAVN